MAQAPGFAYVGVGKQTVAGTPVAPTIFCRWATLAAQPKLTLKQWHDGTNRDWSFAAKVGQWVEASWQSFMYPAETSQLLAYHIGATDGVTGAADPYTHAGQTSNATPQLVSIEWSQGNGQDVTRVTDAYITGVKIAGKAGDIVLVDYTVVGKLAVPGQTPATVSYSTDRALIFADASPVFTGMTVTGGAADVTNMTIDSKMAVSNVMVYGSLSPVILPGARQINCDFTFFPEDSKIYRDVYFGGDAGVAFTNNPLIVSSVVANWDIGGTPDHALSITLNNVYITSGKPSFNVDGKEFTIDTQGIAVVTTGTPALSYSAKNNVSAAY